MTVVELPLNHIACTSCISKIKRGIQKFDGVEKVKILKGSGKVQIKFRETAVQFGEIECRIHQLAQRIFD